MTGLGAALGTGIRLAARRSNLGQPEPERTEPLDGALLSRHRNARRHDTVRRPRHHSSAGAIRCTGAGYQGAVREMQRLAPQWLAGCKLRPCWFEPTFHKHHGQLCAGLHVHVEDGSYAHEAFRPWRLQALAFKALRRLEPAYPLWRDFAYEYEHGRLAIDLINGGESLREWVDDPAATPGDLEALASRRRSSMARAEHRRADLPLTEVPGTRCDILVVGGGINGAGIARDAAGRGLRVVLCEQHDLASHTSSASTKLIHGGLRYLEHYDFGLVRKSLREREIVLASAPHLALAAAVRVAARRSPAPGMGDPRGSFSVRPPRPAPQPACIENRRPAEGILRARRSRAGIARASSSPTAGSTMPASWWRMRWMPGSAAQPC